MLIAQVAEIFDTYIGRASPDLPLSPFLKLLGMIKKEKKMSKIKKFFNNFNLFFYHYFEKKINNKKDTNKVPIDNKNENDEIKFKISNFQNYIDDLTNFYYNGKRYILNKDKLIYLLYRLSLSKYIIRIVCDFCNCYVYNKNIINITNLSKALNSVSNCYIEISDESNQIILDIVFIQLKENEYYSKDKIAKINKNNIYMTKQDNYNFDVDVVYTYVDSKDEKWKKNWIQCFGEINYDQDRYTSHNELKYSLRSINQYMPWVRKIFIVSNCTKPKWLNENQQVIWVDHISIFPSKYDLPTFNSHAIESCLHRIPHLGEHFIYFNDDVFLNKLVHKSTFFNSARMSINFCEPYEVAFWNTQILNEPGYQHAANNVQKIIYKDFNYMPRYLMQHAPHAIIKSVLQEIESRYFSYIEETRKHKVRDKDDISTISFFYPHYAQLLGRSIHRPSRCAIVRENNYKKILRDNFKYSFLCFNSWNEKNLEFCNAINNFFDSRFFIIPKWEYK